MILEFAEQIFEKYWNVKFYENASNVKCFRTIVIYDERKAKFFETAWWII